jgi:hypothetical protein
MKSTMKPASWRSLIKVHPAADLFPMMSPEELRVLGEDIKANGLRASITLWEKDQQCAFHSPDTVPAVLIDGRNRLDAMELVGLPIKFNEEFPHATTNKEPYGYVASANLHRRHLTVEQKRDLIAALLKAKPERSDRATAAITKSSPQTVTKVRKDLEATAQIEQLTTRTGADGKTRRQPTKAATSGSGGERLAQDAPELGKDISVEELIADAQAAKAAAQVADTPPMCEPEPSRRRPPHYDLYETGLNNAVAEMTRRMVNGPSSMAEYLADQKNRKRLQAFRDLLTSFLEMDTPAAQADAAE